LSKYSLRNKKLVIKKMCGSGYLIMIQSQLHNDEITEAHYEVIVQYLNNLHVNINGHLHMFL